MRVISFSADGLVEAEKQGFYEWVRDQDADFICIQDIRCSEYDLRKDSFFPREYNAYFYDNLNDSKKDGVAIYCKELPKAIMTGLGFTDFDMDGHYIQADFGNVSIGSLIAPYAAPNDAAAQARKNEFYQLLVAHLEKVSHKRREFIICGNWRIAHKAKDVEYTERRSKLPGFLAEERQSLDEIMELGYVDAFREVNSDSDEYSFWPGGQIGVDGMRTDFQLVSKGLKYNIDYGVIYKAKSFSTHAPVIMDYDLEV